MRPVILLNSLLALSLLTGLAAVPVLAQSKTLKGGVQETGRISVPGLRRDKDVNTNKDPFSGTDDDGELLEAPKNFKMETIKPTVQKRPQPLRGNLEDEGTGQMQPSQPQYAPQDMGGEQDAIPNQVQMPPQQPMYNPNDPDSSPDMQLAWDMWHKRVAQCIFERFNFFAKAAFRHSPPIMAKLTYTVTRDGHIMNINMPQKSTNILFNVLVFQSVKSLDGDMSILAFPEGSRRMMVPKSGVFTQNYGNQAGFRYTVGDQETVRGQGRR
jgi:hypothetical protein